MPQLHLDVSTIKIRKPPLSITTLLLFNLALAQASFAAPLADTQHAKTLEQAQSYLQTNQGQAAYDILLPLEDELAGVHAYDVLYGRAALAAQHNTRAAMAFERCLAVTPNSGDCRLGMAQAHMRLNENQSAQRELQLIKASAPPTAVARVVDEYLDLLDSGRSPSTADIQRFNAWVDVSFGYDNNVNVAPASDKITLPSNFTFRSTNDSTTFAKTELGLSYQTALSNRWHLIGGANLQTTNNFQTEDKSLFEDIQQVSGYVGTRAYYGRQRIDLVAQGQNYQFRGKTYRNLFGGLAQYNYLLSPSTQVSGFIQHNRLDYRLGQFGPANHSNINATVGGVSLAKSLLDNQWIVHAGLHLGRDSRDKKAAPRHIASRYYGLRSGVTWLWHEQWQAGVNLTAEKRSYDGKDLFFYDRSRKDNLYNTELSVRYQALPKLAVHSNYTFSRNDSNVPMRNYKRQIISLGVRYDFF